MATGTTCRVRGISGRPMRLRDRESAGIRMDSGGGYTTLGSGTCGPQGTTGDTRRTSAECGIITTRLAGAGTRAWATAWVQAWALVAVIRGGIAQPAGGITTGTFLGDTSRRDVRRRVRSI